ncbi:MAG: DUF2092 domain-containing protein [Gammaproteobacteria bacterium]
MKSFRRWLVVSLSIVVLTAEAAETVTDEEALAALERMAAVVSGAQSFSVSMRMQFDVVQDNGQKIQFGELRKVKLARPQLLRVDARQSDGDALMFLSDGAQITLYHGGENAYSIVRQAGEVDANVRFAVRGMGVRFPLARMLLTTFAAELERLTTAVDYVEKNVLDDVPTHHFAGQTADLDYQFWIAAEGDPLPRRVVLTYHKLPGQPQFRAEFADWDLNPEFDDSTFEFTPPADAERVPSLLPASLAPGPTDKTGESQ